MACVESVEIVNEIIVENGCPTKQKVAKHCTKNTFGRKKRVINAQQLRAARKCYMFDVQWTLVMLLALCAFVVPTCMHSDFLILYSFCDNFIKTMYHISMKFL